MARTRWPPGPANPGLLPGQADQTGSAGGCHNLGPGRQIVSKDSPSAASADSEVRPGPRPPTLRPNRDTTREAGPEALPTSSLPIPHGAPPRESSAAERAECPVRRSPSGLSGLMVLGWAISGGATRKPSPVALPQVGARPVRSRHHASTGRGSAPSFHGEASIPQEQGMVDGELLAGRDIPHAHQKDVATYVHIRLAGRPTTAHVVGVERGGPRWPARPSTRLSIGSMA